MRLSSFKSIFTTIRELVFQTQSFDSKKGGRETVCLSRIFKASALLVQLSAEQE